MTLQSRGFGKIILRISSKEELNYFLKQFKNEIFIEKKYRFNLILKNKTLYVNCEFIKILKILFFTIIFTVF